MSANAETTDPFALDYFSSLKRIDVGKGQLIEGRANGRTTAECPPILFVHGAFHGAWCYGLWIRELDRMQWPAAAIDIRGHGDVLPDEVFLDEGAEAFADDIVKAIAAMPLPPILVGHSLGGLLVGIAASCVQVAGLVLLAPSPPNQLAGAKVIPGVPEGAAIAVPDPERTVPWFFPRWKLEDIRPVLDRLTPESPVALNDRLQLRVGVEREKIDAPALCIAAGLDDPDLHPEGQDEAIAAFYGADYLHLPNASHCFMVDPDWQVGLTAILDWWRQC